MNVDGPMARRRLLGLSALLLMLVLCALLFTGCGSNPDELYAEQTLGIYNRWRDIRVRWDSLPGDPQLVDAIGALYSEAKLLEPPPELSVEHELFLKSLQSEKSAFEAYAPEGPEKFNEFDALAEAGITGFWSRMKERGLTN